MTEAYPLAWPEGWPRTVAHRRESTHRFGGLSTNVPFRQDGQPYAGAAGRRLDDPGVAVYFRLKDRDLSMARDGFADIAANMRSLFLAIDGIRQLERHGGSYMMERAFSGFVAIAPPDRKKPWREVLGLPKGWTQTSPGALLACYREKAKIRHPDSGGSDTLMAELNVAYEDAKRELGL